MNEPSNKQNAIEFEEARFTYDGNTFVLDGINLTVAEGEFVCVLGGNGSGKSTMAKHVNALLEPDEGTVRTLGRLPQTAEDVFFIRSNAGMVFQNPDDQLVANLIENDVAFGPENLGVPAEEIRERVSAALAQVGLQGFERKETNALSGGQKQRVAIAGVLAMQPKVLVLDEATAMLDPRGRAGLLRVARELHDAGMTIVMITHFMEEAALADRVVVIDKGRVALEGTPEEVLTQVERLEALSLDVPFAAKLSRALQKRSVPLGVYVSEDDLLTRLSTLLDVSPERDNVAAEAAQGFSDMPAGTIANTSSSSEAQPRVEIEQSSISQQMLMSASGAHEEKQPVAVSTNSGSAVPKGIFENPGAAAAADNSNTLVEFQDVSYSYHPHSAKKTGKTHAAAQADWGNSPDDVWALRNITFTLHTGEFLGIAGHTGSGKSTLIQHMNGLVHPTEGRVLVQGRDIADKAAAAAARANVGLVFQYPEHQLFAPTVFEDVAFGPRNLGASEEEIEAAYARAMALVDLDAQALREASPFELSGGQQRRVAFAGVLAMDPTMLILDEPVAGLDPKSREDFLQLIARLHTQEGLTVVMVSHAMDDLARMCDRVLVLNQGTLHALGTPQQVFADAAACKRVGLGQPAPLRVACALGLPPTLDAGVLAEEIAQAYAQVATQGVRHE